MRLVSWNVDSIRARLALVERWIDAEQPDVIALQETKLADHRFPATPFVERGYELARTGDFFETDRGWRLDHALADPETASVVAAARVDRAERARSGSSDHAPLVIDFER